jgi:branched-chain amino acid transport system substrate-binding protein
VQEMFEQVAAGRPEAVILSGSYAPCAQFIDYARRQRGQRLIFCCMSTVGVEQVQRLLGPRAEGVVASEVVPFPLDPSLDLVRDYQDDMAAIGCRNFNHASLEGYVAAQVLVAALQRAVPPLTEQSLINALASGTFSCGPLTFAFDQAFRQSNHQVFLTQVSRGTLVPTQHIGPPVH